MRWIGFVPGLALLALTAASLVNSLLIPRAKAPLITRLVARSVRGFYGALTSRLDDYERRDNIWAFSPPTYLLALLSLWLVLLVLGFALLIWPFAGGTFNGALREAGSSVFTLGFAAPRATTPTALVFCAAASGLIVVALQIAYLPALYSAFNRRETLVTLLETQAGVPAWGPEILVRFQLIDTTDRLGPLYERWTEWAADLSESHSSYRTLIYFRSPEPKRSWLLALLSVLDAAALHLAICPQSAPTQARAVLRMGYLTLRKLASVSGIKVENDPAPDAPLQLTREQFDSAVAQVVSSGWLPERDLDEAWIHFRGWRVNYEAAAYGLAFHLDVVPALWSGPRRNSEAVLPPDRPIDRRPGSALDPTVYRKPSPEQTSGSGRQPAT
jgi:hypothetical protein